MTIERAIETLDPEHREQYDSIETVNKACRMGMLALEKQLPKKPSFVNNGTDVDGSLYYTTWICPCCNEHYDVDYDDFKFCPNCGQTIDWSGEK